MHEGWPALSWLQVRSPRQHALPPLVALRARRCTLRVRSDGAASADVSSEEEVEAVSLPEAPTAFRHMSQPEHQGPASPAQGALGGEGQEEEGSPHIFPETPSLLISDRCVAALSSWLHASSLRCCSSSLY